MKHQNVGKTTNHLSNEKTLVRWVIWLLVCQRVDSYIQWSPKKNLLAVMTGTSIAATGSPRPRDLPPCPRVQVMSPAQTPVAKEWFIEGHGVGSYNKPGWELGVSYTHFLGKYSPKLKTKGDKDVTENICNYIHMYIYTYIYMIWLVVRVFLPLPRVRHVCCYPYSNFGVVILIDLWGNCFMNHIGTIFETSAQARHEAAYTSPFKANIGIYR